MSEPEVKPKKHYGTYKTGPFKCTHPGCTRSFPSEAGLIMHRARIHEGKNWSGVPKSKQKRKGRFHVNIANLRPAPPKEGAPQIPPPVQPSKVEFWQRSRGKLPCDECNRTFKNELGLSIHKATVHGVAGQRRNKKKGPKPRAPYGSLVAPRNASQASALSTTHPTPATIPVRVQRVNHAPVQQAPIYHCPECGTFLPPHVVHNFCGTCGFGLAVLRQAIDLVANSGINRR